MNAAPPQGLTARFEPFDSFWEGPEDVEKGYRTFYAFYRHNYLRHLPADRDARVLVVSCGPGYFVETLVRQGYRRVTGIDSDSAKVEWARRRGLDCRVERAFPFVASCTAAWDAIVRGGAFAGKGMASFAHAVDEDGAEAIRAYVVEMTKATIGLCQSDYRKNYPELLDTACSRAEVSAGE